jgi:hypothetical protein
VFGNLVTSIFSTSVAFKEHILEVFEDKILMKKSEINKDEAKQLFWTL